MPGDEHPLITVTTDKGGKKTTQLGGHVNYREGIARMLRPMAREPLLLVPSYLGKLAPPGSETPPTKKQRRAATESPGDRWPGLSRCFFGCAERRIFAETPARALEPRI